MSIFERVKILQKTAIFKIKITEKNIHKFYMDKIIKIGLSLLLLICLINMPYGYCQLVRFLCLIGFIFLAYDAKQNNKDIEMIVFIILAILFQPLIKISFGRTIWNIVDVIVAIGLLLSLFATRNKFKQ